MGPAARDRVRAPDRCARLVSEGRPAPYAHVSHWWAELSTTVESAAATKHPDTTQGAGIAPPARLTPSRTSVVTTNQSSAPVDVRLCRAGQHPPAGPWSLACPVIGGVP